MICSYGCGKEAAFQFKNGKWCCSNNFRQCPESRKKYKWIGSENRMYGKHHSEKTIKNFSNSRSGKNHPLYGKHHSEETKNKQSNSNKGKMGHWRGLKREPFSDQWKKNIGAAFKGKKVGSYIGSIRAKSISNSLKETWKDPNSTFNSTKYRSILGINISGEKNGNWRGGISKFPYSPEWTNRLKTRIKERDNFKCRNPYCNNDKKVLSVHHINYDKMNCKENNLITICLKCNSKANKNRKEMERFYTNILGKG